MNATNAIVSGARRSESIDEQHSEETLHVDGNNSGQCQICAFGKYEEGSLLIETMPAKSGRNWLRYQFRQTTSKETCNPFGSEHVHSASSIISNMT